MSEFGLCYDNTVKFDTLPSLDREEDVSLLSTCASLQNKVVSSPPGLIRMNSAPTKSEYNSQMSVGKKKTPGHKKNNTFPSFPFPPKPPETYQYIETARIPPFNITPTNFSTPAGAESPSDLQFSRLLSLKDVKPPLSSPRPTSVPGSSSTPCAKDRLLHPHHLNSHPTNARHEYFYTNKLNPPQSTTATSVNTFGASNSFFENSNAASSESKSEKSKTSSPSPSPIQRSLNPASHRPRSNSTQSTHNYGLRGRRNRPQRQRSHSMERIGMEFSSEITIKEEAIDSDVLFPSIEPDSPKPHPHSPRSSRDKNSLKSRTRSTKSKRKIRKRVPVACVPCNKAKTSCSGDRPCQRCVNRSIQDECINVIHRKKGRPKKNRAEIDGLSDEMVNTNDKPLSPRMDSDPYIEPRVHQTRNRTVTMNRQGSQNTMIKSVESDEEAMADIQEDVEGETRQNTLIQRFKTEMNAKWSKHWTLSELSKLIVDGTMSPTINFSASLMIQSMTNSNYETFKTLLFNMFSQMGFSPPPVFELFTFSFHPFSDPGTGEVNVSDGDDLPIASIRCRFRKSSPTHLRVFAKVNQYAEKMLGFSTRDVVNFCTEKPSHELPFFWRFFHESSWPTLMELEHLAVLGKKLEQTCMVKAVTKTGGHIKCVATIKYTSDDHGIFSSVAYCLIPWPGLDVQSAGMTNEQNVVSSGFAPDFDDNMLDLGMHLQNQSNHS